MNITIFPKQNLAMKYSQSMWLNFMKISNRLMIFTILESMIAFAMSFPRNLNLEQISSTTLNLVLGPRGTGNNPTGLCTYSASPETAEVAKKKSTIKKLNRMNVLYIHGLPLVAPGRGQGSPRKRAKSERCNSRDTRA